MSTETVTVTIEDPDPAVAAEVAHAVCALVHQITHTPGGLPPTTTATASNRHYPRTSTLPDLRQQGDPQP